MPIGASVLITGEKPNVADGRVAASHSVHVPVDGQIDTGSDRLRVKSSSAIRTMTAVVIGSLYAQPEVGRRRVADWAASRVAVPGSPDCAEHGLL